ncbi:MAG: hypothetical protein C0481_00535 [Phenylobacterium sp.]|uniref:SDR family NAD(P)-dependent oxidoreductase n=1 Tax=Phenylobacterium sp. TaxID=1871053 RepID=UPI0025CFAD63|nr:SDR family NAD(P)-dependent oxidoreductase [Phenylobacterium sp.]MBA4010326.1 hypothetical protein [Phenylobacterium sp.]
MSGLAGKVAVVTGGGTGIGRAISLRLARDGADVVVVSNVASQAQAVADEVSALGRKGGARVVDVTDAAAVVELAAAVEAEFGRADILVTSAGVMGARAFLTDTPVEEWRKTIEVNLNAGFYCIKAFLPGMLARDSGRIITVSSISGKLPAAMNSDYAASKHGVIGLTKALALELGILGKNGITANALCPGTTDTPMMDQITDHMLPKSRMTRDEFIKKAVASKSIQRRLLDPEEIADMAGFLASDQARGITGQALNVCGGAVLF